MMVGSEASLGMSVLHGALTCRTMCSCHSVWPQMSQHCCFWKSLSLGFSFCPHLCFPPKSASISFPHLLYEKKEVRALAPPPHHCHLFSQLDSFGKWSTNNKLLNHQMTELEKDPGGYPAPRFYRWGDETWRKEAALWGQATLLRQRGFSTTGKDQRRAPNGTLRTSDVMLK